jgi:tetratricopeptide (TPR) repeat protein
MAPEQAAGGAVTGAADWYAVGVMLFQALTGELPITGKSALKLLHNKQSQPPPKCLVSDESLAELATLADELLQIGVAARPNALDIAGRLSNPTEGTYTVNTKTDTTLVGREKQIASLDKAFHQVKAASAPSIVFVSGRSGEGKTSLVEHFISKSTGHPVVLSGRCYDRESVPFKALDGLIDQLTNHLTGLPEQDAALLMPDDIDFLAELFPVLNRVDVVRKLKSGSRGALDQQQVRTRAFAALKALLTRMTRHKPVVLFSDDLQWGDEDRAEALFQILCTDEPPQLMFVGSYRSDETATSPFITKWRQLTQDLEIEQHLVTVSPLSIDECTQLAIQIIGEDNATIREMVFQFASQTGGNPMLFIELLGCYDPLSDTFEALPIEELIARKLDRLPQSAKPLLQYLAVSGQRSLLDEIAQASATQLDSESVATALRSEKLIRIAGEGEFISIDTYHDKIREAVLRCLADDEQSSMHRSLVVTIEEASGAIGLEDLRRACDDNKELDDVLKARLFDLSYHCDAAGDSQKAYLYAALAARQASQQFSQSVAAEQYAVAKRNLDSNDKQGAFLVARGLCRAHCLLGDYEQAREELEGAIELTTDKLNQAEVLGLQAQIAHKLGEVSQGVDFYGQAIRRIGYHVPRNLPDLMASFGYELVIQAFHTIAPRSWYRKERDLSRSEALAVELFNRNSIVSYYMNTVAMLWTHMKGLNLAETRNDSLELAYVYGLHPAPAAAAGLAGRGLRYSERAFEIANEAGDLLTLGHVLTMRSMACFALGRHAEGAEHGVRGSEYLESAGDTYLRYLSEIHATLCYWQLGSPKNSIRLAIDCFERTVILGEGTGMAGSLYGLTLATEGKLPQAALRSCFEVSDENHFDIALTLQSEGVWHLRHGRYREAAEILEKAWLHARAHFVLTPYTTSCISWLLTAIRQFRENAAEEYETEERELAKKTRSYMRQARRLCWMYPMAKPHLYREIGLYHASRGNLKKTLQWLKKSIDSANHFGAVTESSKSVVELARLDANWRQTIDPEQHERAQETLRRIEDETNAIVSAEWRLEAGG